MIDPCKVATAYAEKMSKCKSIEQLQLAWNEVNMHREEVKGWYQWLIDWKDSMKKTLTTPQKPIEELLNSEGLKALKKGELYGKIQSD
jgi:hypothetical protein